MVMVPSVAALDRLCSGRDVAACVILVFCREGRRLRACAHTIEVV
jgi:hypothetical protein